MRFLIVNTDYPGFLRWLYAQHPGLGDEPYDTQMDVRIHSLFGVADFYSKNLRKLGHEAWEIFVNNEPMQMAWAKENGVGLPDDRSWQFRFRRGIIPWISRVPRQGWVYEILAAQIRHHRPDILLIQTMDFMDTVFLNEIKGNVRLSMGQHPATELSNSRDWSCYDLVISSFPPTVQWFLQRGIPAELHRLGFEPEVLSYLNHERTEALIPISFVGSLSEVHSARVELIKRICKDFDIKVWGPNVKLIGSNSPIRKAYMGQAWGLDMYKILHRSQITLNHHGDVAPYANNLRLFEATGVGTFLITDWKEDLHEILEPGREVVAYGSPEECIELIRYYMEHVTERQALANAGQQRTLREYTFYGRMQELLEIVNRYL